MIRILRLARSADLITAAAFESLFERQLGGAFAVTRASLDTWLDTVLGTASNTRAHRRNALAAARLRVATRDVDFICPSYEGLPLAPLLLALRNQANAPVRLLFIAHAAGIYAMEWAMLRPLLAPGDVIVTPSESARATVTYLCPEIAPWLHVINHPMAPLAPPAGWTRDASEPPRIVSLCRICPDKLIHRQIDAAAVLRDRGRRFVMQIAGPLDDGAQAGVHPYGRALLAKVRRLGLEREVQFVGPVRGDGAKAQLLAGAAALVNLSVTLEESFPKAPVEALGMGVPVLGTAWNGLRDTVGPCGVLVPTFRARAAAPLDVHATDVADGLERLIDDPPSADDCRAYAGQFAPEHVLPRYRDALERGAATPFVAPAWPAVDAPAAPALGLLADAAPLSAMGWDEAYAHYHRSCDALRQRWCGSPVRDGPGDRLRLLLLAGTRPALEAFSANGGVAPLTTRRAPVAAPSQVPVRRRGTPWSGRLANAASWPGLTSGRVACVAELLTGGAPHAAVRGLDQLEAEGVQAAGIDFLRTEVALRSGAGVTALERCLSSLRDTPADELDGHRLVQLCRSARAAKNCADVLPILDGWLVRWPDAFDAGVLSLELAATATQAAAEAPIGGRAHLTLARRSIDAARELLGDAPVVGVLARRIALREASQLAFG